MAVQFAIAFSSLFVEHQHFLAFYQRRFYFAYHFGSCNGGSTYSYITVVVNQQHFLKFNSLSGLGILNVVYKQLFAFFCLELLTVNLYDCVHFIFN